MTKKKTREDREEQVIDEIEGDDLLDGDMLPPDTEETDDLPAPPPMPTEEDNPWAGETRKKDEYSDRDGEQRTRSYTLSIPNDEDAEGRGMLCLDVKNMSLAPQESFECVVIERIMPNIYSVPFNEAKHLKSYEKTIGYSLDGLHPTPDSNGNVCEECLNKDGIPFLYCSIEPPYNPDKKPTPLLTDKGKLPGTKIAAQGECPWGRWGNTLEAKARKEWGIKNPKAKPSCDAHIIMFIWHLGYDVLFTAYHKRTSLPNAKDFVASCTRGMGDNAVEYPFHAFVARYTVIKQDKYFIPKITNTGQWSDRKRIEPVVEYFNANRDSFIKNMMLVWEEQRKKDEQGK